MGGGVIPRQQAEKAMRRQDYTCQCCGFRSLQFQRVIKAGAAGLGGKDPSEIATVCRFCELCLALDIAGATGGGILIWLPEIAQTDLNSLARAIYVAKSAPDAAEGKLAAAATRALDALMARRSEAKKRLGSDDPLLLATVFMENLNDAEYAARGAKLDGIRLLPLDHWPVYGPNGDHNQFPNMIRYWRSTEGPYGKLPVESWLEKFAKPTQE